MFKIVTISLLFFNSIVGLNLTIHDYDNPSASHILDAEIKDDILIISGMIGGIEFYDISDREILNHLTTLQLSSGGGGGTKPNCVIAKGDYLYVTTNRGLGVVNIANPSSPQYLGIVQGTDGYILENLDIYDNFLAIAAHEDGVLFYDITNQEQPNYIGTYQTQNAWAVKLEAFPDHPNYEFAIYVASQNHVDIGTYMYNNNHLFSPIDVIDLGYAVKDISYNNGLIYFAKGTGGVDVYLAEGLLEIGGEIFNCSMHIPCYLDNYDTSVLANRIEIFDNKVAVADWDDIEVLEWNGDSLEIVGYKNTTRRTMALATKENYIYSAEWAAVQIFEYGEINGPDIDLNIYELNYPYVENGESYSLALDITNNGNEALVIDEAYTTNDEFYSSFSSGIINPGETETVNMTYSANSINSSGSYRINSNDIDESEVICETNGNINGANIGDVAPDFALNIIANGNGIFRLSDYLDQIVVLAFFSPM